MARIPRPPGDGLIDEFRRFAKANGVNLPREVSADGKLRRFNGSAWYVLFPDGVPVGVLGDWRSQEKLTWRGESARKLTPAEEEAFRARIGEAQRQRDEDNAKRQAQARALAQAIWDAAKPARAGHRYLRAKGVKPHGVRVQDDRLLVPLHDAEGTLQSLQEIFPDGKKRFLPGASVGGCSFTLGKIIPNQRIAICEGVATAASIYEASDVPTVVAFFAGNLLAVAKSLRAKYPQAELIVCADDDYPGGHFKFLQSWAGLIPPVANDRKWRIVTGSPRPWQGVR